MLRWDWWSRKNIMWHAIIIGVVRVRLCYRGHGWEVGITYDLMYHYVFKLKVIPILYRCTFRDKDFLEHFTRSTGLEVLEETGYHHIVTY